jgi:hypothetical protein
MTKTRDLQRIALDMSELLLKYSGNYLGSPYKNETDLTIQEYNDWAQKSPFLVHVASQLGVV